MTRAQAVMLVGFVVGCVGNALAYTVAGRLALVEIIGLLLLGAGWFKDLTTPR